MKASYINSYVEELERKIASTIATTTAGSLANGTPPVATPHSTELDHGLGTSRRFLSYSKHLVVVSL
jgi:hypothetical protein